MPADCTVSNAKPQRMIPCQSLRKAKLPEIGFVAIVMKITLEHVRFVSNVLHLLPRSIHPTLKQTKIGSAWIARAITFLAELIATDVTLPNHPLDPANHLMTLNMLVIGYALNVQATTIQSVLTVIGVPLQSLKTNGAAGQILTDLNLTDSLDHSSTETDHQYFRTSMLMTGSVLTRNVVAIISPNVLTATNVKQ